MALTEEQQTALSQLRALFANWVVPFGSAKSSEERAAIPETGVPEDIIVRVETAQPSSIPNDIIPSTKLRNWESVPIFFYTLRTASQPPPPDAKVILHIHGGGSVSGHPAEERFIRLFSRMLRALSSGSKSAEQYVIAAPSYRLSTTPQNAFPGALQDLVSAYDYLITQGYKASNIVISGDSAGGNHALILTYLISKSPSRTLPSSVVTYAPVATHVYTSLSEHARAQSSVDIFPLSVYETSSKMYLGDSDLRLEDPLISGIHIPFNNTWPKTLILVGTGDQLIDTSRTLEQKINYANVSVELVEYDRVPHGWWTLPHIFPNENQDALHRMTKFVLGTA
ncbi:hypothetical protein HYDPIDRAFT_169361 [Hydnomerulius pinastri MD-312]|uniref:Alpha/beta hydrolase fold-3 domain-containing protein n=1 Tax=Hydnomerulius pinastri MD-312 TaxID=994086 RepID=A0A0C9V8E7_9AGAM|nr:hypothetical protein HYDPIDRAFT_169361 [Hydnomerulius pinastri MD-312]